MDLAANKPVKWFLKHRFEEQYSGEVLKQLQEKDLETVKLQPISLYLPSHKELGAMWLVKVANYDDTHN